MLNLPYCPTCQQKRLAQFAGTTNDAWLCLICKNQLPTVKGTIYDDTPDEADEDAQDE